MNEQRSSGAVDGAAEQELMRSSSVFLTEVARLQELEQRKRAMAPDDEARLPIAREIEDLAVELMNLSRYQSRLVRLQRELIDGGRVTDGAAAGAVERTPAVIVEEWRAAERRLHDARATLEAASDEADRLRDEHRRSFAQGGSEA